MTLNTSKIYDLQENSRVLPGIETVEGEGVRVNRLFPVRAGRMHHDPFVLWDHFKFQSEAGFPEHPHRGFEGITYLFDGGIQHKDDLGNQSTLLSGGAQRFTAGKGIHHSEMPLKNTFTSGIQLWINLPRELKQLEPGYQQVDAEQIPEQIIEGIRVRSIVQSRESILLNTSVQYLDLLFEENTRYRASVPSKHNGIAYVVKGEVQVLGQTVTEGNAYLFSKGSDESAIREVDLIAAKGARIMLATGKPHNEPIYQHGPFVD